MNNLKKILSLALACMMLLSLLAGCGGQTSGGNEPSDSTGGEQSKGGSSTQGSEITCWIKYCEINHQRPGKRDINVCKNRK